MNQKLKQKWVEALRSGKYRQSSGYLQHGDGFCCLGVLCDVIDPNSWADSSRLVAGDISAKHWKDSSVFSLPAATLNEINLTYDEEGELIGLNDNDRPFEEIANHIEKNL